MADCETCGGTGLIVIGDMEQGDTDDAAMICEDCGGSGEQTEEDA